MRFKDIYRSKRDCKSIRSFFSEYVDAVLQEEQQLVVHNHIQECNPCAEELRAMYRTVAALHEYRHDCLPVAVCNYRLPRSIFIEVFPTITAEKKSEIVTGSWAPYFSALLLFCLILSGLIFVEHKAFERQYNASNYVEVITKV